jgi:hypothetical protein
MSRNNTVKREIKTGIRVGVNSTLITAGFVIFGLVFALNPEILRNNRFISLQIVSSIPLLLSATLARTRSIYAVKHIGLFKTFHAICFESGYAMIINSIGILLSIYTDVYVITVYFTLNVILSLIFSVLEVAEEKDKLFERVWKDGLFITLIILLGLLPALKFY